MSKTWRVYNKKTGKIYAYNTTLKKATRQIKLLNYLEHSKKI